MTKRILPSIICTLIAIQSFAQLPDPCGPEGMMAPWCEEACVICDIDGFLGRNDGPSSTWAPDEFCSFGDQKVTWIAFIAGTETLELTMEVSNCTTNLGLQVGIFRTDDCMNFERATNCENPITVGNPGFFSNVGPEYDPLVVGQHYYIIMDGNDGDECDYLVTVTEGSTFVDQLQETNPIVVPELICANQPFSLSFDPQVGASSRRWTVDGVLNGLGESLDLTIEEAGQYEICIDESNACDDPAPYCTLIDVMPQIEETRNFVICEGDTITFKGVEYWVPGTYEDILVPAAEGCDSLLDLVLEFGAIFEGDDFYNICEGDTLFLNDLEHFETGVYDHFLLTEKGCDSIVHVNLFLVICNMVGSADPVDLLCFDDGAVGSFSFRIEDGTPPFEYEYVKVLDPDVNGSGTIANANEDVTINDLPAGSYIITVNDTFGNFTIINTEIEEPDPVTNEASVSDYNGFNISCNSIPDGSISLTSTGGTPGYSYAWNISDSQSAFADNLPSAWHVVTVTDDHGCEFVDSFFLDQPADIEGEFILTDPNCDGLETGAVSIFNTTGGVPGYSYSLNGGPFSSTTEFSNLPEGTHTIVIKDINDCEDDSDIELDGADIPVITVEDITVTLGDSINVAPGINEISISKTEWTTEEFLDCYDCFDPYAFPLFNNAYNVSITSTDGCERSASFNIFVEKDRTVYKPNIFSPTLGDDNGFFLVSGGQQIKHILSMHIYDRWGNEVYEGAMIDHRDFTQGWDGTFQGKELMNGVYAWVAQVEFLDGFVETLAGDITLIK